jgi:predicted MFS family arabinose efflux permease
MVPVQAMLLGVPHPKNRGAFMSVNTSVQHASTGLAPMIAGALVTVENGRMTGYPMVGYVAAATAAISLLLAGLLKPSPADTSPLDAPVSEPAAEEVAEASW